MKISLNTPCALTRVYVYVLSSLRTRHALSHYSYDYYIRRKCSGAFFYPLFAEFLRRDHRRRRFLLKSARPRSAGGNCTVPGALYVPEVSRDLRFSFVMREAPSDGDVGGEGKRGKGFHCGGCARLSRHALMRRRGYGSGLYKVLINGVYAFSLCARPGGAVFTGVSRERAGL